MWLLFHTARPALGHCCGALALLLLLTPCAGAAQSTLEGANAHFSPAALPIVFESLRIEIDQQHAHITLTQHFKNPSSERLEGRYLFRTGEGTRVNGLRYWHGEQEIVGEVFERELARQVYHEVTGLERDPALFEQVGEGTFSFRIFPIEPGETKRIELRYDLWLGAHGDRVQLRAPLASAESRVSLSVRDPRSVRELSSKSHVLRTLSSSDQQIEAVSESAHGEIDSFELQYRVGMAPLKPSTALHRSHGQDAYLLLHMATPERVASEAISPKDVTIVIDHSGSMSGEPLLHACSAARQLVHSLSDSDRVNLLVFDDQVELLFPEPRAISKAVRAQVVRRIDQLESAGGTDIALALKTVLAAQNRDARPNVVLFMTDGQSDAQAALAAAKADTADTRVFTIGLGAGVEKPLLARLAADKRGRFVFIADVATIESEVARLYRQISAPLVTDLRLESEGAQLLDVYPRTLPDLFVDDELRIMARVATDAPNASLRAVVHGTLQGMPVRYEARLATLPPVERPWVGQAWGQARVDDLLQEIALHGEREELKNEAVEIALAYNFVTPFTSFLAIPASELTAGAQNLLGAAREHKRRIREAHPDAAALSRDQMPPGDPVISVRAPADARQVTAVFPFGLTLDLSWDGVSERWLSRFLVPKQVADGVYEVELWIVRRDGSLEHTQVSYTIDSQAEDILVHALPAPGGLLVRVLSGETPAELRATLRDGAPSHPVTLSPSAPGCAFAFLPALPGRHVLRVVKSDAARNEQVKELVVELPASNDLTSDSPAELCQ